jgi:hypothetical protein
MSALRSTKYLAGSRGAQCALQIEGVCAGGTDATIPAHIRDRHTGRSQKASDLSVADSCFPCHEVFDRRAKLPSGEYITDADWTFYALRGLQETLERRRELGLLFVPEDAAKPFAERPAKPRKPKAERHAVPPGKPMESRSNWPPKGSRKLAYNATR